MGNYLKITILLYAVFLMGCQKENAEPSQSNPPPAVSQGSFNISVIEDEFMDTPVVLVGSGRQNLIAAFSRNFAGGIRTFSPLDAKMPVVMEDDLGNHWDVFGNALLGPNKGEKLEAINSGMGFWFAFGAFYPGVEIYGLGKEIVDIGQADTTENWSVATAYVAQGAGFDGIPAIDEPTFETFEIINSDPSDPFYVNDEDLVIGVSINGETKTYPHKVLDWHEVVNDEVGGTPISVTYCPLTGTGKVWERQDESVDYNYGVSGFLYNSNILAFDRVTESLWSQLEAVCIFGELRGNRLDIIPFVETTWKTWRNIASSPVVLSDDTGFDRNYDIYPYGDYRSSELISYPLLYQDDRLHPKERVFSIIIAGQAKVYRLSDF